VKFLYLLLNIGSISIPFLYSFHPKLKFYKYWKALFISIVVTMLIYLPWDIIFTNNDFWGFNNNYFIGYKIFNLPLEEWLFFICIPYACVFTHYALLYYFPSTKLSDKSTKKITSILIALFLIIAITNYNKWYTFINFLYAAILLLFVFRNKILNQYYLTFLVMLIPFFIVNGVLTGSFITDEVVWYNNDENLGIRLGTIPIEDSVYAFTLILTNLSIISKLENRTLYK